MTDSTDIVQRARAALDGITPGPWWWTAETRARLIALGADKHELTDAREIIRCAALLHPGEADARFIAAAPDLVRELAAEVEKLRSDFADEPYLSDRLRDARRERDEAQVWAAWFAAERDHLRSLRSGDLAYCEEVTVEVEKLRAAVERVRNLVVWTDPDRCGGEPCVRGTRVWVSQIVDLLEDCTDEMIAAFYPTVKPWQVSILRALDGSSS